MLIMAAQDVEGRFRNVIFCRVERELLRTVAFACDDAIEFGWGSGFGDGYRDFEP